MVVVLTVYLTTVRVGVGSVVVTFGALLLPLMIVTATGVLVVLLVVVTR